MSTLIDQLFDPATLAVNMIGGLVIALVLYGLLAWILPPKSAKVFWSAEISLTAVSLFLKPIMPSLLRIGLNIILSVLLPVSLLSGTLLARVVVCFLGTLALTLGDIVAAFSWMSITGLEVAGSDVLLEHFPVYLAVMVGGDIGVTSLIMALVHWLEKRFLPADMYLRFFYISSYITDIHRAHCLNLPVKGKEDPLAHIRHSLNRFVKNNLYPVTFTFLA